MDFPRHDRYDFIPIDERPDYSWPDGKRLAVYFGNNVEEFAFGAGLNEAGLPTPVPTQRTYAQRDYGNRVGIWRMLDLFDDLGAPASHNINTAIFEYSPQVAKRIKDRGDEMIGHGRTNSERQDTFSEAEEKEMIDHCVEAIEENWGKRPTGWLSPFLAESEVTPDLLKEAGFDYILNWPCDDQPFWMRTRSGPLLYVPYTIALNDLPVLINTWRYTPRQYAEMLIDQFDEMLEESQRRPLVFCFSLHTFVLGHPFRTRALRQAMEHIMKHRDDVWVTTPGEIAAYCKTLPAGIIPGS
jgi:peptidoglycan/xylan/chitin deacetylase (PgdA/CDA1 family)